MVATASRSILGRYRVVRTAIDIAFRYLLLVLVLGGSVAIDLA